MSEPPRPDAGSRKATRPPRWYYAAALAPVALAVLALAGLLVFHCARI